MGKNKDKYSLFSDNKQDSSFSSDDALEAVCPKLSYKQRIYGFCICAAIGWLLSFFSFIAFFEGNDTVFAIIFTCGNLIAIMSTCFLAGPKEQAKKMVDKTRYISSIIFASTMVFTLVCALAIHIKFLTLISALAQFAAYGWYSLSFIPYGQKMFKNVCKSCLDG